MEANRSSVAASVSLFYAGIKVDRVANLELNTSRDFVHSP